MEQKVHDVNVLIEQDEEGWFVATAPDIPGCHTQGKTIPQVFKRIKEAIELCLEAEPSEEVLLIQKSKEKERNLSLANTQALCY